MTRPDGVSSRACVLRKARVARRTDTRHSSSRELVRRSKMRNEDAGCEAHNYHNSTISGTWRDL
ncbi:conserved hypothetical protein [Ricinus communis]|uniref:Uncharacterized protein n=1 Tax=Ricinus communis TaxID=3988 RepID=B9RY16_RICCO|nr:conserved hypothetical protein [Ricinus communis]